MTFAHLQVSLTLPKPLTCHAESYTRTQQSAVRGGPQAQPRPALAPLHLWKVFGSSCRTFSASWAYSAFPLLHAKAPDRPSAPAPTAGAFHSVYAYV